MRQNQALKILKGGHSVFLTGAAGSGKTYLLKQFIKFARKQGKRVAVTATTGLAATHLNGRTIHSWTGIGIESKLTATLMKKIKDNKSLVSNIAETDVLVIDEVSMLSDYRLDMIDAICREVRKDPEPFGGLQVVLSGDFFQLPPIEKDKSLTGSFAVNAHAWQTLRPAICYLHEQYRQKEGNDLSKILNALRNNRLTDWHIDKLKSRILPNPGDLTELYCHNRDIDTVNAQKLALLAGRSRLFVGEKKNLTPDKNLLDNLVKNCLAAEELHLKQKALVMFVSNDPEQKYINGTLGEIVGFHHTNGHPVVLTKQGRRIYTEKNTWKIEQHGYDLCTFKQIPLKLAWAMTVHKSQGLTLDGAFVDLSKTFEPGMGYVALSRLTDLNSLYLKAYNTLAVRMNEQVLEIDQMLQRESELFLKKMLR